MGGQELLETIDIANPNHGRAPFLRNKYLPDARLTAISSYVHQLSLRIDNIIRNLGNSIKRDTKIAGQLAPRGQ